VSNQPAPTECAICGAEIPRNAHSCPECGADEQTGWREQSLYDGLDLPDDEMPESKPSRMSPTLFWKLTCIALIVLFVVLAIRGL
jgi:predicted nucleic acid-binding Zn ribbon protein